MNNLFNFIIRHIHWLLFFFLTSFSIYLLVHNNEFQRSKYLSVFQEIAGRTYSVVNGVQSYINLNKTNADLMQRIGVMEEEIQGYKNRLEYYANQNPWDTEAVGIGQSSHRFVPARVVLNQVTEVNNYILLDKGSKDGITEDMAVISIKGIVGVVDNVTANFSHVIPVLNPTYHPSCMIKNTRYFGPLFWDGKDPRYIHLRGLPGYALYAIGDTIVTTGYSETFPEGVHVGVIEDVFKQKNEEYNSLIVRLFTDFSTLREVFIIKNPLLEERKKLERGRVEE